MNRRIAIVVSFTLLASALFAEDESPQNCRLIFERDSGTGQFVATVPAEPCRARLVEKDLAHLSSTHKLGRVRTGSVDLASSSLDTEADARGVRILRWKILLPERFDVNPSVSTLFVRVASSKERGLASITKCNIREDGFDLVVVEEPDSQLFELEIEWIAYEFDPPVTPPTCEEPRG